MALGERFLQHVQSLRPLSEYRIDIQHTLKLDTHDELVLEDSISGFWQSQTAKNEYFIRVMIAQSKTSKEINNKPQRRFESLIPYWLEHLAGHLCATPFTTEVLAKERNCFYRFEPTTKEQAQSMLRDIINTWQQGLSRPLNIDSKAGCTLANGMINDESSKAFDAALTSMKTTLEYDKGYFTRAFGRNIDPQVFITSPSFIALSELLYSPMIKAIHIVEGEL
jgi:exodeoxyribonuclease V gamma subunit